MNLPVAGRTSGRGGRGEGVTGKGKGALARLEDGDLITVSTGHASPPAAARVGSFLGVLCALCVSKTVAARVLAGKKMKGRKMWGKKIASEA